MANFKAFHWNISSSINILFLKSGFLLLACYTYFTHEVEKKNTIILLNWVAFFPPKYLEIKLVRQIFQIWILYTGKPFYEINKNHVQWRVQKNALRNLPIWTFFVRKKIIKKNISLHVLSALVMFSKQLFRFFGLKAIEYWMQFVQGFSSLLVFFWWSFKELPDSITNE